MIRVDYYLRVVAAIIFGFSHPEKPSLKCIVCWRFDTAATALTQRQTSAHVQRRNDHKQRNGTNVPYPPSKCIHFAAVSVCRF